MSASAGAASAGQALRRRIAPNQLLIVLGAVFVSVNAIALSVISPAYRFALLIGPIWLLLSIGGEWWLNRKAPNRDIWLFPVVMIMAGWGTLAIYRLLPDFGERQLIWLILGAGVLMAFASLRQLIALLRGYRYLILLSGILLLVTTILFGTNPSGAPGAPALWISLGIFYVQPSELLKIMLVAFVASYCAEQYPHLRGSLSSVSASNWRIAPRLAGPLLVMWGICVVLLIWQRDLGTAILFFVVFALMLYVTSGLNRILVISAGLILVAGVVAYLVYGVVRLRIDIWWNPWLDPDNTAYQIVQSLQSIAAGGLFGQGIGQGSPYFVPVAHSDFILAAIGEEWGFLGIGTALCLLALVVTRAFRLATGQPGNPFRALLATGLGLVIGVQTVMIAAGVTKILPLTGVTLPFFSYGGSSLIVMFAAAGLLINLSASHAGSTHAISD